MKFFTLSLLLVAVVLFALGSTTCKWGPKRKTRMIARYEKICLKKGFKSSLGCPSDNSNPWIKRIERKKRRCQRIENHLKACGYSCPINGAKRDRSTGEIAPANVTQFVTFNNDEDQYGASRADDLDFDTASISLPDPISGGEAWFKATLGEALCVERIKVWQSEDSGLDVHSWTCTETGCTCDGLPPADYTVTVSTEAEYDQTLSDCKYGDTVEVQSGIFVKINEIAIFEKQGSSLQVGDKIRLRSVNYPTYYVSRMSNGRVAISDTGVGNEWIVRKGLIGKGYSLQSVSGGYIRHRDYQAWVDPESTQELYRYDASFTEEAGAAGKGITLRSVNFPGHVLRHQGANLYIRASDGSNLFKLGSSFIIEPIE